MASPFDVAKNLCTKADMTYPDKDYVPFMVNKIISMRDPYHCVLTNYLNLTNNIPKENQFYFLMDSVTKGNGFIKWLGKKKGVEKQYTEKTIAAMIKVYQIRTGLVETYLDEMSIEEIKTVESYAEELERCGL